MMFLEICHLVFPLSMADSCSLNISDPGGVGLVCSEINDSASDSARRIDRSGGSRLVVPKIWGCGTP